MTRRRPVAVQVLFGPGLNKDQLEALYKAEDALRQAGVSFDTGYDLVDKSRDWEWDWSLRGPVLVSESERLEVPGDPDPHDNAFDRITEDRIRSPLEDEAVILEGEVTLDLAGFPETWEYDVYQGKDLLGKEDVGKLTIGPPRDPIGGILWTREGIVSAWVSPEARGRGVGSLLVELYRDHVGDPVIFVGPLSSGGRALARKTGSEIVEGLPAGQVEAHYLGQMVLHRPSGDVEVERFEIQSSLADRDVVEETCRDCTSLDQAERDLALQGISLVRRRAPIIERLAFRSPDWRAADPGKIKIDYAGMEEDQPRFGVLYCPGDGSFVQAVEDLISSSGEPMRRVRDCFAWNVDVEVARQIPPLATEHRISVTITPPAWKSMKLPEAPPGGT